MFSPTGFHSLYEHPWLLHFITAAALSTTTFGTWLLCGRCCSDALLPLSKPAAMLRRELHQDYCMQPELPCQGVSQRPLPSKHLIRVIDAAVEAEVIRDK